MEGSPVCGADIAIRTRSGREQLLISVNITSVSVRFHVTRCTMQLGESKYNTSYLRSISADRLVSVLKPSHPRSISKIISIGWRTLNVGLAQ